jgi:PilZ domain
MAVPPPAVTPPAVEMTIGSAVTLLPVDLDTGLLSGEITHWAVGAAGLVATIGVRTTADVAVLCIDRRLWLCGREAARDELVVFEVVARPASTQSETNLIMTGVLPLAQERRRNAVRAQTRYPVRLTFDDTTSADGVAADLSRSGCLIALNRPGLMRPVGTRTTLEIELPGHANVSVPAHIVRIDSRTAELAVHFEPIDIDLSPIDRLVYAAIKRQNTPHS